MRSLFSVVIELWDRLEAVSLQAIPFFTLADDVLYSVQSGVLCCCVVTLTQEHYQKANYCVCSELGEIKSAFTFSSNSLKRKERESNTTSVTLLFFDFPMLK